MKLPVLASLRLALVGLALAACTHTPPGTSVELALARKAEYVRGPVTASPSPSRSAAVSGDGLVTEKTEKVAEAYARGEFCLKAGKDEEAIAAFREVVKLDKTFVEAWNYLAALYERAGKSKESLDAYKHAKEATGVKHDVASTGEVAL